MLAIPGKLESEKEFAVRTRCSLSVLQLKTEKAFEIEAFSELDSVFHSAATIRWMRASAESPFARPTDEERRAAIYVRAS